RSPAVAYSDRYAESTATSEHLPPTPVAAPSGGPNQAPVQPRPRFHPRPPGTHCRSDRLQQPRSCRARPARAAYPPPPVADRSATGLSRLHHPPLLAAPDPTPSPTAALAVLGQA